VIASVRDGAMQMLGNNALVDVAHCPRRWNDRRLVVAVLNNRADPRVEMVPRLA
jgi:pyruvate dehydrogenase (quinone)